MAEVESVARALGEPWDAATIERFNQILAPYIEQMNKQLKQK